MVRCTICNLVQFETRNLLCRRCNRVLPFDPPTLPKLEPQPIQVRPDINRFGECLAFYRNALEISRRLIHRRTGIGLGTISKVEHKHAVPSVSLAEKIIEALDIPAMWLFEPPSKERANLIFAWRVIEEVRTYRVEHKFVRHQLAEIARMRQFLLSPPAGFSKIPRRREGHEVFTGHSAVR